MQQWEYCQLRLSGMYTELRLSTGRDVQAKKGNHFYSLAIRYFGEKGGEFELAPVDEKNPKSWPFNPWDRAIGMLGLAGWELVAIQYGNSPTVPLYRDFAIATFKRPVEADRRVDEPKLVLE